MTSAGMLPRVEVHGSAPPVHTALVQAKGLRACPAPADAAMTAEVKDLFASDWPGLGPLLAAPGTSG
ncbi:MAG TPA: hypothetical protein VII06_19155 [Chloroflexota bacterium]|jgi:hypothetical protein